MTSWNWSLANGLAGLLAGVFGVVLARSIPNRLLLAAVASALAVVIGFLFVFTDIWLGTADDVVELLLFLSSPAASFITGQTIVVDGGITC